MITTTVSMMNPVLFKFIKAITLFMMCLVLQDVYAEQNIMCMEREKEALLQFKAALVDRYGMLSSWSNTSDCCQWEGIRCNNLTGHVLVLDLHGHEYDFSKKLTEYDFNQKARYDEYGDSKVYPYDEIDSSPRRYISGEIHKSLMELRQLKYLNLSMNSFPDKGIPEFLGSMRNLRYLDLSQCNFGGKIPTQFGSLSHLKYLNLVGNYFLKGSIPPLENLSNLQYLYLSFSSFEGNLPSQLGNLSMLEELYLIFDTYEGNIPSQLGNLSKLQYLYLGLNSFHGNIPPQLGNLSNLRELYLGGFGDIIINDGNQWLSNLISLTHLYLFSIHNLYTHSWPQMIAKLPKLKELSLHDCSLSDHFIRSFRPSKFNSSTSLSLLDLSHNTFTSSVIFQWVSNITSNLVGLDLSGNFLESSTSNHFGMVMNSLEYLDLSNNRLKGEVSQSFMNLCSLCSINMAGNNFTEELSSILHNLSSGCVGYSLQELDLSYNHITGSLPDLSVFPSLKILDLSTNQLSGNISESIRLPSQLKYLLINSNSLEGGIPISFGNACALASLDLSQNDLNIELPVIIHHLSGCARYSLRDLNLRGNRINGTLSDLSIFSGLKTLDLSKNQLNGKIPEGIKLPSQLQLLSVSSNSLEGGVPKSFGNACNLRSLYMSNNSLSEEFSIIIQHLSGCARNSIQELRFVGNKIDGTFPDLSIFSTLKMLNLSDNQLNGKIPEGSKLPSQLETLSIRSNSLEGGIPKSFGNACTLHSLDMHNNSLSQEFPVIIHHLSGCAKYSLGHLDLGNNQINGTLPDLSIFSSLEFLYLGGNKLNGEIPKDIQFPPQLIELDMRSNSLKGVLTNYQFANMSKLNSLQLSDNSLALTFTQNWVPPFQLFYIGLRSCMLGPSFPDWLQTQNEFGVLDISNASISDVVPKWLWAKLALREWISMDISYNNLYGVIPNFPLRYPCYSLILGSNQFEGPIPPFLRGSLYLDLSKNKFSDSLAFLCANGTVETLYQLDLSYNQLSGQISDCLSHFKSLSYLDLSHNNFSGKIPTSLGSLLDLQALLLRNNNLAYEIPFSLRNCTKLLVLDLAENRLSGPIPAWIGSKIQDLQILSLGKNHFNGSFPLQICYLRSIRLLDLSLNSLSGKIPECIKNFTSMAQKTSFRSHWYLVNITDSAFGQSYDLNAFLMWKGSEQLFKNNGVSLLKSIDLSSNHFSEEIPVEVESLLELVSLNLSRNNLTGKIPSNVGNLKSLEFLDLSRNQLVGSIPLSLTQIDRLTMLDLSHNRLTGEIPTSTQLQSFNASSYEDNLDLCGPPLEKLCTDGGQKPIIEVHEDEDLLFSHGFYISMALGFVISFWLVFGSILFKRSWRHAYFKFLNNLWDIMYVKVAVFAKGLKGG